MKFRVFDLVQRGYLTGSRGGDGKLLTVGLKKFGKIWDSETDPFNAAGWWDIVPLETDEENWANNAPTLFDMK